MNTYATIIVWALVADFLIRTIIDVLNVEHAEETIPEEFQGVYDPEAYRKSQDYLRVSTQFSVVTETVSLATLLAFWFAGGFAWLDTLSRLWTANSIAEGLVFIGLLFLLRSALTLPFPVTPRL